MARKPRLSLLLPVVQVTVTAVLIIWSDRVDWMLMGAYHRAPGPHVRVHFFVILLRRIYSGINAPTFPLCFATGVHVPVLEMGVGEMLYLLAVALLWFWVGRYLDRKKGLEVSEAHSSKWRWILPRMSALGWGVFLLLWNAATLDDAFPVLFLGRRLFRIDTAIVRVLFLLWSVFLIALPLIALTRDLNRKRSGWISARLGA